MWRRFSSRTSKPLVALRGDRFHVLLLDYEMARDDERATAAAMTQMLSISVAVAAGIAVFGSKACQFRPGGQSAIANQSCDHIPNAFLAAAPMVILATISFFMILSGVAIVRAYYMRALEQELREAGARLSGWHDLQSPSLFEVQLALTSFRRGRRGYRLLYMFLLIAIITVFAGIAGVFASVLPPPYQIGMATVYGPAALFMVIEGVRMTLGGRTFVGQVLRDALPLTHAGLPPPLARASRDERSLLSYVILPRPRDVVKWLFFPIVFLVVAASIGWPSGHEIARAGLLLLVLEYFIYEARYQWNDIVGFPEDQAHPDRKRRGRLPGPKERFPRNATISLAIAAGRIAAALALAAVAGDNLLAAAAVLLAAVFGAGQVYEVARSYVRRGPDDVRVSRALQALPVWILVGVGYGIRGGAGAYAATPNLGTETRATLIALVGASLIPLGCMFVTLTWALEASTHCKLVSGRLIPGPGLARRAHLDALLRYVSEQDTKARAAEEHRALENRGAILAPWNGGLVLTCGLGGVLGAALASQGKLHLFEGVVGAGIGVASGAVLTLPRSTRSRVVFLLLGAALAAAAAMLLDVHAPGLFVAPWLISAGLYVAFRAQSYATLFPDVEAIRAKLQSQIAKAVLLVIRLLVGQASYALLKELKQRDDALRR